MTDNMNQAAFEMEMPTLTLPADPEEVKKEEEAAAQADKINVEDKIQLTPEEEKAVTEFISKIDLTNATHIMQYGAEAQSKLADFSDSALDSVKTKDLGSVGDSLSDLVLELKGFSALEEKKGLAKLFGKATTPIEQLKTKYTKANTNVEKVVTVLEGHQVTLTKDIAVLDELYKANSQNFKELSMYIVAGKRKLEQARTVDLPEMQKKAAESGNQEDVQALNDYVQMLDRFEKKIYDLDLTRTVSLQMAPQIRLVQNNDVLMIEKIQTALVNTIPLWKSQMVLALGLANSQEAVKAQRAVSDTTNELLRKNAEALHQTTVEVAKESERGIIDIETLKETNQKLISTIDEVLQIQKEGHEKREAAEVELAKMENELKDKLLEIRK